MHPLIAHAPSTALAIACTTPGIALSIAAGQAVWLVMSIPPIAFRCWTLIERRQQRQRRDDLAAMALDKTPPEQVPDLWRAFEVR